MIEIVQSFILGTFSGLVSGLLACLIFWVYLRSMRPSITISPFVAAYYPEIHRDYLTYSIRILNNRLTPLVDLAFHLRLRRQLPTHRSSQTIPLMRDHVFSLDPKEAYDITFYVENNEDLHKNLRRIYVTHRFPPAILNWQVFCTVDDVIRPETLAKPAIWHQEYLPI